MANKLKYINEISQGSVVESWHVSQSIEAFSSTNQQAYDISISGSFRVTGSQFIEPINLLNRTQDYVLSYDDNTGQIFKMLASQAAGSNIYRTGSNNSNIIPEKFGNNEASGSQSAIIAGSDNKIKSTTKSVIGGGQFNLVEKSHTFIGGGRENTSSGACSFIGAGKCNQIPFSNYGYGSNFIGAGVENTNSGEYSAIISGCKNEIKNTLNTKNTIISGFANIMGYTSNSIIGGGSQNEIPSTSPPSYNQFIGAGFSNTISTGQGENNSILGGSNNIITGGYFGYNYFMCDNSIIGGKNNCITFFQNAYSYQFGAHNNFIGAGEKNLIGSNDGCVIIGKNSGIVAGTLNTSSGCNNFIGAGRNNTVKNWFGSNSTANSVYENSSIVGGCSNCIIKSPNTFIGGGKRNTISSAAGYYSGYSAIVAGTGSCIDNSSNSFIGSGVKNSIGGYYTCHHVIGGGYCNQIYGGTLNSIVGGKNNYSSVSDYSFIGGGRYNSVAGTSCYSGIIEGKRNSINLSNQSFIGAGYKNCHYAAVKSGIGAGNLNYISSPTSFIGAGTSNKIYSGGADSTIVSGKNNNISGYYSYNQFIGGGYCNIITSPYPLSNNSQNSIVGGCINCIDRSKKSSILGGGRNYISGSQFTSVIGGIFNSASVASCSFMGGGQSNTVSSNHSSIVGGHSNFTTGSCNAIIGGCQNCIIDGNFSLIGVGTFNTASGLRSTIIAGSKNSIISDENLGNNFIGSGFRNCITGSFSAIVQGQLNTVSGSASTIVGGCLNVVSSNCSFIGGGQFNKAEGLLSAIVAGSSNTASAARGFIGAGRNNEICTAGEYSAILSGDDNTINHACSYIIGSDIASHAACTTHVNNLTVSGSAGGGTGDSTVIMRGLPTTDPSVLGQLWVDPTAGYALKVSQGGF